MDQNLFVIQTVFTGIAAIAIVLQMAFLFAMYRAVKAMQNTFGITMPKVEALVEKANEMIPRAEALMATTKVTLEESLKLVESARDEFVKVDVFVNEATTRARAQMDRVEMVLDDAMDKAQQTVNVVSRGVLRPVREIQGVAAGIQAALAYLLNSSRPSVDHATSDEEMFI